MRRMAVVGALTRCTTGAARIASIPLRTQSYHYAGAAPPGCLRSTDAKRSSFSTSHVVEPPGAPVTQRLDLSGDDAVEEPDLAARYAFGALDQEPGA